MKRTGAMTRVDRSANTKVMDAQHHSFLKFYGLTLTGGNAEGGIADLAAFGGLGGVTGMANVGGARAETQGRV